MATATGVDPATITRQIYTVANGVASVLDPAGSSLAYTRRVGNPARAHPGGLQLPHARTKVLSADFG